MRTPNRFPSFGGMPFVALSAVVLSTTMSAQTLPKDGPGGLVLPQTRRIATITPPAPTQPVQQAAPGPSNSGTCLGVVKGIYKTCREAAVAALRAGNDAATGSRANRDRAIGFYLLSIDRDPAYGRALFNLGVMAAKARPERWSDALKFYQEAARLDSSTDLAPILKKETTRVEAISQMESTPEGQHSRKFDLDLIDLISRFKDPAVAVETAKAMMKSAPERWEGPAAAGILQAALARYDESAASLETASRLAPAEMRGKMTSATLLAKNEAQFVKALQQADTAFESKNYADAGRLYADAWQASPGRVNTGMQAAVSFLLADRVSLAVQLLTRLRQLKSPELSQKAAAMLKELGVISPEAKAAAADGDGSSDVEQVFDVAERIRTIVGDLRTPEIELVTGLAPALAIDNLEFVQLTDDEINHPKEEYVTTTESLFDVYLKRVGNRRVETAGSGPAASGDLNAPTGAAPDSPPPADAAMPTRPQPLGPRGVPGTAPNSPAPAQDPH